MRMRLWILVWLPEKQVKGAATSVDFSVALSSEEGSNGECLIK